MTVPSAAGPFVRAGLIALLMSAVWWTTARSEAMPPVSPLGPQPVYSSLDAPALVWLEPVLHAPWIRTLAGPWVWIAGFLVLLGASGVAVFAGASTLAATCVLAALVMDTSFNMALTHGAGLAIAVGLVWLAAGAAFDDRTLGIDRRPWLIPLSAMLLWTLAVWWDWIAIVAWPIVWAAFRRTPDRPLRGWWTPASLLLGLAACVGHFAWIADAAMTLTAGIAQPLTWRDAVGVGFDQRPRMPLGSFAAPELTARSSYALTTLAAVGLFFGVSARWWRRAVILTTLVAMAVALLWSEWQAEVLRFSSWAVAPLAAVGLTWVAGQARRPAVVTLVLGAIAIADTLVLGARPLQGVDGRRFRDTVEDALSERAAAAPIVLVAEDTRIDSALVPWIADHPTARRAAQDGEAVARARAEGRVVLAGPAARRHLELSGVSLAEAVAIADPAPFALAEVNGTFRCVAVRADRWSQLPGLEYTGRLGIEIPPRLGGELQLVVGDTLPLPLRAVTPEARTRSLKLEPLLSGPGAAAPPADYWFDEGSPGARGDFVRRVRLPADPVTPTLVGLDFGRRAPRVIARLDGHDDEARGRVCAAPVGTMRLQGPGEVPLPLDDEDLFGTGWYGREGPDPGPFRWADLDAVVLVRSAVRADVEVRLEAAPATSPNERTPTTISLRVNGLEAGTRVLRNGVERYTWQVPARMWLAGTNELWWHTSRAVRPADHGGTDTRSLALRVTGITLARQ